MIYIAEDKVKFQKATHCHICEGALPKGSTNIDHLAKIGGWLKIMGLPKWVPTYKEVEKKNHQAWHRPGLAQGYALLFISTNVRCNVRSNVMLKGRC